MANPEHVEIVRQGARVVAEFRKSNPNTQFDLTEANFFKADLSQVDLSQSSLIKTNLVGATLHETKLNDSDLQKANLFYADLKKANLSYADLTEANLCETDLTSANLNKTNLQRSSVLLTSFNDLDLSSTKGLNDVRHFGPSSIDHRTIKISRGHLPDIFLNGCGHSAWEICFSKLHNPQLTPQQASALYSSQLLAKQSTNLLHSGRLYISYAIQDSEFAFRLYDRIQSKHLPVWLNNHELAYGDLGKIYPKCTNTRGSNVVISVISQASISSTWFWDEINQSFPQRKQNESYSLCPIVIDENLRDDYRIRKRLMLQIKEQPTIDFTESKCFDSSFISLLTQIQSRFNQPKF